jgi:non-ribosomal peptide synthetase component F
MTARWPRLESLPFAAQREGQYDVTLVLGDVGDELEVSFDYRTELYDAATIERLGRQLVTLADCAVGAVGDAARGAGAARRRGARGDPRDQRHGAAAAGHDVSRAGRGARRGPPGVAGAGLRGAHVSYAELETRAGASPPRSCRAV